MNPRARLVWPALTVVGVLAEFRSLKRRDGATLSEFMRAVFHVKHPVGKAAFVTAWGGLSWFLLPHILRAVDDALSELGDA